MNLKSIFEKRMFWLVLVLVLLVILDTTNQIKGINKTVGWAYDLTNFWILTGFITFSAWILYIIGYGIMAILKYKTSWKLSILHFLLIVLTFLTASKIELFGTFNLIVGTMSILIFYLNIRWTLKHKLTYK